jgi:hypothetical protein
MLEIPIFEIEVPSAAVRVAQKKGSERIDDPGKMNAAAFLVAL